jgi:hypothetical protein
MLFVRADLKSYKTMDIPQNFRFVSFKIGPRRASVPAKRFPDNRVVRVEKGRQRKI